MRAIAIHLPQFHPVRENDEWWGKGFTEWTNVAKAKPLFKDHYQPHIPADLGFYDLRLEAARIAQAELARQYNIYGFCYYHYWFNGRRILERPVHEILQSGKPDFPFCFCWANENWTRIWDGSSREILLEQKYSEQDDIDHIRSLIPAFKDPRYIKVNGKAFFAVYRTTLLPDPAKTIATWREVARREGVELYICRFENFGAYGADYIKAGFDASIEFQPHTYTLTQFQSEVVSPAFKKNISLKLLLKLYKLTNNPEKVSYLTHQVFSHLNYNEYVDFILESYKYPTDYTRYPCVMPSWDNTARRGKSSLLFKDANPDKYEQWLSFHSKNFSPPSPEEDFIFINAWNEWAEGNHLEPCLKWGNAYLTATKNALAISSQ